MTRYVIILLLAFVTIPAFANSGFMPVYQPNLPGGGSPPTELYCTLNEFLNSYNSTTNSFTCAAGASGGENNTASNIGSGLGWYKQKVGVDLQFNSAIGGQGIDITDTTNDLTISTDFKIDTLPTLSLDQFIASFDNSTGDWTTKIFSVNTIDCGTDFVQEINNQTGTITCAVAGGGISDGDKGDITVSASGATWTIDNNVVTYAKMQDVSATSRFLGRITTGSGDTEELTGTQATTLLDAFTSALKGLVPASGGGTSNFLRADGTWAAPTASGGAVSLGADVTCSSVSPSYCTVFTIPLTASSGNAIEITLVADSNTAGAAVQPRVIFDNAGNTGYCTFRTYTTATAEVLDVLAITTTTADTGETVWLAAANTPMPINISCGLEGDATPGNAVVQIQQEVASTGTVQKGSFYLKTP